mmetsp:Transcript_10195/g.12450  ORF Transcript_10195/g.12450 Transcript_10195/m.12450 type:complete len:720 (-) Transcript_10195:47-2206(-)
MIETALYVSVEEIFQRKDEARRRQQHCSPSLNKRETGKVNHTPRNIRRYKSSTFRKAAAATTVALTASLITTSIVTQPANAAAAAACFLMPKQSASISAHNSKFSHNTYPMSLCTTTRSQWYNSRYQIHHYSSLPPLQMEPASRILHSNLLPYKKCRYKASTLFSSTFGRLALAINRHNYRSQRNQLSLKANNEEENRSNANATLPSARKRGTADEEKNSDLTSKELLKRIVQLERILASQSVEISKLKQQCTDLTEAAAAFTNVVELLRQAGLTSDSLKEQQASLDKINLNSGIAIGNSGTGIPQSLSETNEKRKKDKINQGGGQNSNNSSDNGSSGDEVGENVATQWEAFDESEIFGTAPGSVIDAADAAGGAILAAMLAGKRRMLVDVRDAELSRDYDTLVQFIELAILPVAAGLEGLYSYRNRVKIVFPTVWQLLKYRKAMALVAPDVVGLSTLGFGSVEKSDNLVVILAPSPDDDSGNAQLHELLQPANEKDQLSQPIVVINHHMLPMGGVAADFYSVYHLKLLSVQYMTGDRDWEYIEKEILPKVSSEDARNSDNDKETDSTFRLSESGTSLQAEEKVTNISDEDAALEAAMNHANEVGIHQGITRAMVIRAYPRPWHVFVDTSPDIDADFEVAATFDEEPSEEEVNMSIVDCLEGSEREDELVAQQMQEALESGQLKRVSEILGMTTLSDDDEEVDDDEDPYGIHEDDEVST